MHTFSSLGLLYGSQDSGWRGKRAMDHGPHSVRAQASTLNTQIAELQCTLRCPCPAHEL